MKKFVRKTSEKLKFKMESNLVGILYDDIVEY